MGRIASYLPGLHLASVQTGVWTQKDCVNITEITDGDLSALRFKEVANCKKQKETVKTPLVRGRGSNPQPPGPQSDTLTSPLKGLDLFAGSIRPRIFRIRHPWGGTLCQNSQGRCGNHCKKQEEPVKTPLVPGGGSNPQPPGPQSDTLTSPLKGLDPFAGSVGSAYKPPTVTQLLPDPTLCDACVKFISSN
ncbi:hypothetical protein Bbelb_415000 [Branchiostoma belcheri]|nr:hypothetical protein Bbelb_415000 [Branchiostoma belcheri]